MLVQISCRQCGKDFSADLGTFSALALKDLPKKCPACCDERQARPAEAVAVSRHALAEFPAVRVALPDWVKFAQFQAAPADARAVLRATIKGKDLRGGWSGVSWNGRLDIYCLAEVVPSVARVRVMEVIHTQGHKRVEVHGAPMGPKESVEVAYSSEYIYLALEPETSAEVPTAALILASVGYKTTLKGFGRQWHAKIHDQALWSRPLSNSCRSGRYGINGVIAVVDDDHPIVAEQYGDVESSRVFNLSRPFGE